jgi:uncharacterized protein with HEPN domain
MKNSDNQVIENIIYFCTKIQTYIERFGHSYEELIEDTAYQDLLSFCLEHIGELVNHLSEEFMKQNEGQLPFRQIIRMRNIIIHNYESVDLSTIWNTTQHDIPVLEAFFTKKLKELQALEVNSKTSSANTTTNPDTDPDLSPKFKP